MSSITFSTSIIGDKGTLNKHTLISVTIDYWR